MSNRFKINISQEDVNYLQRLGFEIDSYKTIIDHLFTMHKNDLDDSLLKSIPFKSYMEKFEIANAEYELAKNKFGEHVLRPIVEKQINRKNVTFDWNIENFAVLEADITILD